MDLAAAAELFARKQKLGAVMVQRAASVKLDAERMLGEYLKQQPKATGSAGTLAGRDSSGGSVLVPLENNAPTLKDLGISKKLSAEAQRLADIPDETFAKVKAGEIKPTVALRDQRRAELGDFGGVLLDEYRTLDGALGRAHVFGGILGGGAIGKVPAPGR